MTTAVRAVGTGLQQGIRILIADDSLSDRLLLQKLLQQLGHQVVSAADGQEACRLFQAEAPDLVLLDAVMPGMDGIEAARRIKAGAGERLVPIIFLTALTDANALANCLDAGGDDFISKPYSPIILKAKISAFNRMREMHATLQQQRDQIALNHQHMIHEQQVARIVFDNVAHHGSLDAPNIRYLLSPLSVFNGDVLLACYKPAGGMHVLMGDFTGHGLPAAIGAMPLAEIFYGMTRKGFGLADILREINRKLKIILPVGFFCCAAMVDMDFDHQRIEIWMGGVPDVALRQGGKVRSLQSNHLPLGILAPERFKIQPHRLELRYGDKLYLWSDGVLEASNERGQLFGEQRLLSLVEKATVDQSAFDAIQTAVSEYVGGQHATDDLTLVELTMLRPDGFENAAREEFDSTTTGPRNWYFKYGLRGDSLQQFDPVPIVLNIALEVPALRVRSGDLFIILTELFNNAVDHGLLGLDSALKHSVDGFAEYYRLRSEGLRKLRVGEVSLTLEHALTETGGCLKVVVTDSGPGFDPAKLSASGQTGPRFSGRGLPLVRKLCRTLEFSSAGNRAEAVYEWSAPGREHG